MSHKSHISQLNNGAETDIAAFFGRNARCAVYLFVLAVYPARFIYFGESRVSPSDAAFPTLREAEQSQVLLKMKSTLFASLPTAGGRLLGFCSRCTSAGSWFVSFCCSCAGVGRYLLCAPAR